jgi:hypothetical protein
MIAGHLFPPFIFALLSVQVGQRKRLIHALLNALLVLAPRTLDLMPLLKLWGLETKSWVF